MKHLKRYNESYLGDFLQKWINEVINTCNEILFELSDLGMKTFVRKSPFMEGKDSVIVNCEIGHQRASRWGKFGVVGVYNRLADYMESEGFKEVSRSTGDVREFPYNSNGYVATISFKKTKLSDSYKKVEESKVSKIDKKIQLLKELAVPYEDEGYYFEITKERKTSYKSGKRSFIPEIIVFISNKTNKDVFKEIVEEFLKDSEAYGMKSRGYIGNLGDNSYQFVKVKFDGYGKMTDSALMESRKTIKQHYGDIISKMEDDIEYVKEILFDLDDIGYKTSIDYTPLTAVLYMDSPRFYITVNKDDKINDFYDSLNKNKNEVDGIITKILYFLEENNYKIITTKIGDIHDSLVKEVESKPTEFKFFNNPTYYQIVITI